MQQEQRTGIAAAIAAIAAVGSYIVTCTGHPGWGLILAIISIPVGVVGLVMSTSPRVTGGLLSIGAIVLGAIAVVVSILGLAGAIAFGNS